MEIGAKKVVDEFFLFLVLCSACLVLEDNIVVPSDKNLGLDINAQESSALPSLNIEIPRVQQRVPSRNIKLSLFFFFGKSLCFLCMRL